MRRVRETMQGRTGQRISAPARSDRPEGPPPTSFVRFIGLLPRRSRGRLPFDWSTGMYYTPARWHIGPGRARCEMCGETDLLDLVGTDRTRCVSVGVARSASR